MGPPHTDERYKQDTKVFLASAPSSFTSVCHVIKVGARLYCGAFRPDYMTTGEMSVGLSLQYTQRVKKKVIIWTCHANSVTVLS